MPVLSRSGHEAVFVMVVLAGLGDLGTFYEVTLVQGCCPASRGGGGWRTGDAGGGGTGPYGPAYGHGEAAD